MAQAPPIETPTDVDKAAARIREVLAFVAEKGVNPRHVPPGVHGPSWRAFVRHRTREEAERDFRRAALDLLDEYEPWWKHEHLR